jgi:AAA15 family ATPase/GTPase
MPLFLASQNACTAPSVHENKITPEKPSFEGVLFMNFHYIDSIKIEKFKCFADFNVDGLKRVNLIGGKNNVGKTAFLEACFLIVNTFNLHSIEKVYLEKNKVNKDIDRLKIEVLKLLITIQQNRDRSSFVTQWLYEEVDLTSIGFFVVEIGNQYRLRLIDHYLTVEYLKIEDKEKPHHNVTELYTHSVINFMKNKYYYKLYKKNHPPIINNSTFVSLCNESEISAMIDDLKLSGEYTKINRYLNELFNVNHVDVIKGDVMLQQDGRYRKLNEFGDGLRHFINIVLTLLSNKKRTVYLDEVDNGIHHSLFDTLWEIILTTSTDNKVQVFATTHSQECIDSYARVVEKRKDEDITFIELGRNKKDKITSIVYDYKAFINEVEQGQEVRGW